MGSPKWLMFQCPPVGCPAGRRPFTNSEPASTKQPMMMDSQYMDVCQSYRAKRALRTSEKRMPPTGAPVVIRPMAEARFSVNQSSMTQKATTEGTAVGSGVSNRNGRPGGGRQPTGAHARHRKYRHEVRVCRAPRERQERGPVRQAAKGEHDAHAETVEHHAARQVEEAVEEAEYGAYPRDGRWGRAGQLVLLPVNLKEAKGRHDAVCRHRQAKSAEHDRRGSQFAHFGH